MEGKNRDVFASAPVPITLLTTFSHCTVLPQKITDSRIVHPSPASSSGIPAAVTRKLLVPVSSRLDSLEQDESAPLVAILGSERQGGEAVEICLIWVGLCLEQYMMSDLLVAILNSVHQGGPNGVVLSAHDGARLEQVES